MNKLKLLVWIGICGLVLIGGGPVMGASPESRILKEVAGPDQSVKHLEGLPVIISKKTYFLVLKPETIFPGVKDPFKFTLIISNPTQEPWSFSLKDLKAYSEKKDLTILEPEKVISDARKKFSEKEYKLSKEQAKALAPFIEDKMQTLRDSLIKNEEIPAGGKVSRLIFIDVPLGTETLTLEVTAPKEIHKFKFNIIEM